MAINFLNTVDLNFNQLNKAAIQNLGTDPAAGVLGQIYYNTAVSALKICTTAQVIGGANAVYTEVGATSGVETISIGNANVNAGGVNTGLVRTPGTGIGDVVITPAIYGGAANVGMVPTGGTANKYLDGTGAWIDVTTGDIESVNASTVNNRLGIAITTPLGPDPTVGLNIVGLTNLGATPASSDELIIYDVSSTTNKAVTVGNLVGGFETTYTLPVTAGSSTDPKSGIITLTGTDGTTDPVTFVGTTGRIEIAGNPGASTITVDLTDNVSIVGKIDVLGSATSSFAGDIDMNNNKLTEVKTGTVATDGVNLGQVEALVAGIGLFKGGYNATTGLTTDLGAGNGSLDGNNNIALDQGDFFVVTVAGGAFYTQTLEVGDMIFANTGIAANSTPPITDYTVVIQDANIAGAGSTDGGTQKGVAGFDSANFTASATGWVQLKEEVLSGRMRKVSLTSGDNTTAGETTFTVNLAAAFGSNPTPVAADCIATVKETTSNLIVYPCVTGNGTGSLDFVFMPQVTDGDYTAIISIV